MSEGLPRWRTFWIVLGILILGVVLVLALMPMRKVMPAVEFSDKIAHFVLFAGLMVWFAAQVRPKFYVWVLVALLGYGVGMETLQSFRPHRSAELADLVADAAGLLAGWGLCRAGLVRWPLWIEGLFRRP